MTSPEAAESHGHSVAAEEVGLHTSASDGHRLITFHAVSSRLTEK